jgi:hypothetical protein
LVGTPFGLTAATVVPELGPAPATTTLVLEPVFDAGEAGIGSKVTLAVYAGPPGGQPPLAAAPLVDVLVELPSVTSLTPSIRRRRVSRRATEAWLVAQPETVKLGTLPAGVAPTAVVLEDAEDVLAEVVEDEEPPELVVGEEIWPESESIDTDAGITRPNSWKT